MKQITHIKNNKENLIKKAMILNLIRNFFISRNFIEIDAPVAVPFAGQEPFLSPVEIEIKNEKKENHKMYLHTSPEYTLKKTLAGGFEKVFSITHCFRDEESFGGLHNPEFTMIEWYRTNENFFAIMDDCENLVGFLSREMKIKKINFNDKEIDFEKKWERIEMKDLWKKYVGIDLEKCLDAKKMYELNRELGFNPNEDEAFEDLFYRIFLNKIEPNLGSEVPTIVYNYPKQMSALAKISDKNPNFAERFEIYVGGVELANCFTELTDAVEQKNRFSEEQKLKKSLGKKEIPIDSEFVEAVGLMPPCAGIALGVDRLAMLFLGCKNIDNVLVLPMSKFF